MTGRVLLVGAGPGDGDLITLRGLRALEAADVVLADRLTGSALRTHAPNARWVDVGKAARPGLQQQRINDILVAEALAGHNVVRLKGGDPLIFGRADQELEACRRAGVPVGVVPGVTAAQAAAAEALDPLTGRDADPWLVLVPGHEGADKLGPPVPWERLADLGGTLAVYMGVANLGRIAERLTAAGRPPDTPVTLAASVGHAGQNVVRSRLGDVARDAEMAGIQAPAILLVHQGAPLARPSGPGAVGATDDLPSAEAPT